METKTLQTVPFVTREGTVLQTTTLNPEALAFESWLDTVIIGQAEGKRATVQAFRRTQSKLRRGTQPFGAFIFLGPTSCGKSEAVYRFAEYVHGDRRCVLKIDGSEYIHDANLTKLTGATNQWVGRVNRDSPDYKAPTADEKDSSSELNQHNISVYSRCHSKTGRKVTIILVDEWEKACKEFNDIWLSILRDGRYTNGASEELDFSECIVFFTGNLGSRAVEEEVDKRDNPFGFIKHDQPMTHAETLEIIEKHLKEFAAPEFRSRVDELGGLVVFDALNPDQVFQVCGVKVREMQAYVQGVAGLQVAVPDDVKRWLLKNANNNLSRVNGGLQTLVVDMLDNELIKGTLQSGDTVTLLVPEDEKATALVLRRELQTSELILATAELLAQTLAGHALPGYAGLPLRTDECDPAVLAGLGRRERPDQSQVDRAKLDDALKGTKDGAGADNGQSAASGGKSKNDEEPTGRVFHPFCIESVLESESAVVAFRDKILKMGTKFGFERRHEEITVVTVRTKAGPVEGHRVKTHVLSLMERMTALKRYWPELTVSVEELEIPE